MLLVRATLEVNTPGSMLVKDAENTWILDSVREFGGSSKAPVTLKAPSMSSSVICCTVDRSSKTIAGLCWQ